MESCILRMHKNTWVSFVRVRTVEDHRLQFASRFAYSVEGWVIFFPNGPPLPFPSALSCTQKGNKYVTGRIGVAYWTSDLRRVKNAFIRVRL